MNKRFKKPKRSAARFPKHTPKIELIIDRIGGKGDGVSEINEIQNTSSGQKQSYFVPGTLPGEHVLARPVSKTNEGIFGQLLEIIKIADDRVTAPCSYFGVCGGCSLQHWAPTSYQQWKIARIKNAIEKISSPGTIVDDLVPAKAEARRRADLSIRHLKTRSVLGFYERDSNKIVDIEACSLLDPEIINFSNAFRKVSHLLIQPDESSRISINKLDTGLDVLVFLESDLSLEGLEAINDLANSHNLCRVSASIAPSNDIIPIIEKNTPIMKFSEVSIIPPPGAFLQATKEGTRLITEAVISGIGGAKRILELFSGCGTLSIPLQYHATVHAVEGDQLAAAALRKATVKAGIDSRLSVEIRDLIKDPVPADKLSKYDAIVFDPPRSGAKKQAEQIAKNGPHTVVAVSCNPNTFARDGKILIEGGYELKKVTPIDQFLWSPHIELVALFYRTSRK